MQRRAREIGGTTGGQQTAAGAARQGLLDAIGLSGADQALWARVTQAAPPLPAPFRDALFHAPQASEEDAAVIFLDRVAWTRATGLAHAGARARLESRVADLCHRPGVRVHYLLYEDVLRLLSGDGEPATVAVPLADEPTRRSPAL
jgi:hypothetical protein